MYMRMRRQAEGTERALLFVGILAIGLSLGWHLYGEYLEIDRSERSHLAAQAKIIDENLQRQLIAVNNALASLQAEVPALQGNGDAVNQHLQSLSGAMPGVRTLFVVNGNGVVVASNRPQLIGRDLRDRAYFGIALQSNDPNVLHVSSPINNALGIYSINLERSMADAHGHFSGLVGATLEPDYFATLLNSVNYAPDMWSSIVHADGTLFLIMPPQSVPLGSRLARPGSFFQRHLESGQTATVLSGKLMINGQDGVVARRTVQPPALNMDQALMVAVTRNTEHIFAPWHHDLQDQCALFLLLAGSTTAILIIHQQRQRRAAQVLVDQDKLIKSNDEQLRLFFDRQLVGMAISTPQKGWLRVNDRLCEITGYPREELMALTWGDLTHPDDSEESQMMFQRLLSGQIDAYTLEKRYIRKGGGIVYVDVSVGCVRQIDGTIDYVLGVVADNTARKLAEQTVTLQSTRYSSLLKTAVDGIHILDQDGNLVEASDSFWNMLGYAPQPLNIQDWEAGIPADELAPQMMLFIETPGQIETQYRRANGEVFHVEVKYRGVEIDGTKYLYASSRDITRRKQAELALRERDYLLTESQRIAHVGSWHYIIDGLMTWSEETYRIFQVSPETFVPNVDNLLSLIHHEDRQSMVDWITECAAGHKPGVLEFRIITPNGEERIISGYGELQCDLQNRPKHMMGIALDVTERRRTDRHLRVAAAVFESSEGMIVTDADGYILRVNGAFTELTGFSEDEVVGKTSRILKSGRHSAEFYVEMWRSLAETGTWQGEICDRRKNGEVYPQWLTITAVKDDRGQVTNYVSTLLDITTRKKAEEEIKHLAFFDPLTNLPNRRLCMDRLAQALASSRRTGRDVAVMFIDLDHFKQLNDAFGHDAGDKLLQQVAVRLQSCVREGDTVARLGGDEFVIMLENLSDDPQQAVAQVEVVGGKVLTTVNTPFTIDDVAHHTSPSIGVVLFNSRQTEVEDLLKCADSAMYAAKSAGRNAMRFFQVGMEHHYENQGA